MTTLRQVDDLMKLCQIGCGGNGALEKAHDIMSDCYGTLGAMSIEIRLLRDALKEIADLSGYYSETPNNVSIARKALSCKKRH